MVLSKLIAKSFLKSKINYLFFFFSFILSFLLLVIWQLKDMIQSIWLIPASSCICIICISFFSLPTLINNFKKSQIFQKINSSIYSETDLCFSLFIYFLVIEFLIYFINFFLVILIYSLSFHSRIGQILYFLHHISILETLFSIFVTCIICNLFGILIGLTIKTQRKINIISTIVLIVNLFLSFQLFPYALIKHEIGFSPFLAISYFWPFRYTNNLLDLSMLNGSYNLLNTNIFSTVPFVSYILTTDSVYNLDYVYVNIFDTWEMVFNLIIPCIIIVFLFSILIWKLKITNINKKNDK